MLPYSSLVAFFLVFLALITWTRKSWKWWDVFIVVVAFAVCTTVWRWMYAREYRANLYVPRSDKNPDPYLTRSNRAVNEILGAREDEGRFKKAAITIREVEKQRKEAEKQQEKAFNKQQRERAALGLSYLTFSETDSSESDSD